MPEILTRREGAVTTLLFSNPARMNAMSRDMWNQLAEGIRTADADPSVRVIVLRGEGKQGRRPHLWDGKEPTDRKPMDTVGAGVKEIRIQDESGAFRVIYLA